MTNSDRAGFAEFMLGLGETYNEPVSDARQEIYFAALADLPLEAIRHAATVHVRTSKFFPRPSELREAIVGNPEDAAELAWMHVLREVRRVGYMGEPSWPDEATRRAADEMFGGWRALCELLPAGGPELIGHSKQFEAAFAAYARRDLREQAILPPGREEAKRLLTNVQAELAKRGLGGAGG